MCVGSLDKGGTDHTVKRELPHPQRTTAGSAIPMMYDDEFSCSAERYLYDIWNKASRSESVSDYYLDTLMRMAMKFRDIRNVAERRDFMQRAVEFWNIINPNPDDKDVFCCRHADVCGALRPGL